ncbi:UPAR/Ly6 domain-containing protein crok-like [Prorops nasuta]|uniref:UPAR/Ly6 domain-containing protein crok-like n=1 Tax=Prorops nasuta TaxID=863751 RepID=UPI0034CF21CB
MLLKNQFYIITTLLVLICLFEQGYSIKCWVCRSDSDPKCSDPFDNSTVPITDCKQEPNLPHLPGVRPTMCRKIRQKVHNEWRYFRSCAYMGEPGIQGDERFCLMRTGTYNIFMEYCTCNSKDGCNTATYTHGSLVILLVTLVFSLTYSLHIT